MNAELYHDLVRYLGGEEIREEADEWRRELLKKSRRQFELHGTTLFRKGGTRAVVSEHKLAAILEAGHNHHLSGHMGADNTLYRLQQNTWWPGMEETIRKYVRECDICQKRSRGKQHGESSSSSITPDPFHHIGIDVMGPLPRTLNGNRYVIVAVDYFTKWTEATAVEDADAQTVVKFIHTDIICRHGVPKEITSDRGTEFLNELVTEFERTYRIKHIKTTAYHPQGNGQTERMNQTLKNILSKICKTYDTWDNYLESALFAVRTARQVSTKFSPFELLYGKIARQDYHINAPKFGEYEDRVWSYVTNDISRLQLIRKKAAGFIEKAQERERNKRNKDISAEVLKIGDLVLLYRNITESSWSAKLERKWEGPYFIHKIKGQSIWLRRPNGSFLPTALHRNRLKKYHENRSL
jgi:transposase InsO family protein